MRPKLCALDDTVTTRGSAAASNVGSSSPVSAKWPRWLVPSWLSNPSAVVAFGTAMIPALFMSTSSDSRSSATPAAHSRTDASDWRSSVRTSGAGPVALAFTASSAVSRLGRVATRQQHAGALGGQASAERSPSPLLAPVIRIVRPV